MRIQHNIAALNSYRNLTNNNSAVAKNLEKLSSGYRINRAGDDAAGLAISEKMRAQITGLNTAKKNANDGISLVQTAEGALTEVHSMLNRMVELATQSANGTYDKEPDRQNLQKEIDSLKSEIDRISKGTNFNGINLLDGTFAKAGAVADSTAVELSKMTNVNMTHIADGALTKEGVEGEFTLDLTNVLIENRGSFGGDKAEIGASTAAQFVTFADGDGTTTPAKVTLDFSGMSITAPTEDDGTVATGSQLTFTIGDQEVTIDVTADMTEAQLATAVLGKVGSITIGDNDVELTGTVVGNTIEYTAADNNTIAGATAPTATLAQGKGAGDVDPVSAQIVLNAKGADGNNIVLKPEDTFLINAGATGNSKTGVELADSIVENLKNGGADAKIEIEGETFTVTAENGVLKFKMDEKPTSDFTADLTAKLEITKEDGTALGAPDTAGADFTGSDIFINQAEGIGAVVTTTAVAGGDRIYAQGSFTLSDIQDGSMVKIGKETYIFSVGADSKFTGQTKDADGNVMKVVSMADAAVDADGKVTDIAEAARALARAATDNTQFKVAVTNKDGEIRLTEKKVANADDAIDYTVNDLQGDSVADRNDATANGKKPWDGLVQTGTATIKGVAGSAENKGLVLQIGDTSKDYNQLSVDLKKMDTEALGIKDIDISTQEGAAAAIDQIKTAINSVSSTRGDLGAIQNRLEHTINNLSVTAENMTAAESRIRDVDMAEEMMAYTKNNILVQAAQAMLAQANQVPQGVLQLLQ